MLDRELLRRLERSTRRRRLREVAVVELRCVGSGRTQCVACDLTGGIGCGPNPEWRLEGLGDSAGGGVGRQLGQPSHEGVCDGVSRLIEACGIGPYGTDFDSL